MVRSKLPPYEVYKLHQKVMDVVCGGGQGLNNEAFHKVWRFTSHHGLMISPFKAAQIGMQALRIVWFSISGLFPFETDSVKV